MTSLQKISTPTTKKILLFVAILLLIAITAYFVMFKSPKEVGLEEITWPETAPLVAVNGVENGIDTGILFVRLTDGAEQFIAGTWNADFDKQGAYTFGQYPDQHPEGKVQKVFYLATDRVHSINLQGLNKPIIAMQRDPSGKFTFVSLGDVEGTQLCITKDILTGSVTCNNLQLNVASIALWHPSKDGVLLMKTVKNEYFEYPTDTLKMSAISEAKDAEKFEETKRIFDSAGEASSITSKPENIFRAMGLALIKTDKGFSIRRLPSASRIAQFGDNDHLLVAGAKELYVLELSTNKRAVIAEVKNLPNMPIIFSGINGESTL